MTLAKKHKDKIIGGIIVLALTTAGLLVRRLLSTNEKTGASESTIQKNTSRDSSTQVNVSPKFKVTDSGKVEIKTSGRDYIERQNFYTAPEKKSEKPVVKSSEDHNVRTLNSEDTGRLNSLPKRIKTVVMSYELLDREVYNYALAISNYLQSKGYVIINSPAYTLIGYENPRFSIVTYETDSTVVDIWIHALSK